MIGPSYLNSAFWLLNWLIFENGVKHQRSAAFLFYAGLGLCFAGRFRETNAGRSLGQS